MTKKVNDKEQASRNVIKGKINVIRAISHGLHKEVQEALILTWLHTSTFHDHSMFMDIVNALGEGVRHNAVKAWVETFTYLDWNTEEKKFVKNPNRAGCMTKEMLAKAKELHWSKAGKSEPEYVSINLEAKASAFISSIKTEILKGNLDLEQYAKAIAKLQGNLDDIKAKGLEVYKAEVAKTAKVK